MSTAGGSIHALVQPARLVWSQGDRATANGRRAILQPANADRVPEHESASSQAREAQGSQGAREAHQHACDTPTAVLTYPSILVEGLAINLRDGSTDGVLGVTDNLLKLGTDAATT